MQEDEINLLDLLRVFYQRKLFILFFALVGIVVSFMVAFLSPKIYQSQAVILPTNSASGKISLGALGNLAALGGLGNLGSSSSSTRLLVILKSHTLAKMVLAKLELRPFLYPEIWDAKKNTWKEDTKIPHDFKIVEDVSKMMVYKLDAKDGTINLLVECKDPEIAAKIVNQYLEELKNFVEVSHLTTTKMDEIFFEKQLKKVKKSLFEQSKVLTNFYRHNNVSSLKSLVALDVDADSKDKPIEEVPSDVYLNYLNGRQKLMQGLYASLEQQYQMARMSAEHNDLSFEIIDPAEVP